MQLSGSLCGCFLFHFFGSRWLSASAEAQRRLEYSPSCLLLHSPNLFSILPLSKDVNIKQRISRLPQGHSFLSESFPVPREKMRKLHLGGKTSSWPFIPLWKNYYQYPTSIIFVFSWLHQLKVRIPKSIRSEDFKFLKILFSLVSWLDFFFYHILRVFSCEFPCG